MRSVFRRAGWIFLAVLFLGTGLGVGVVAFWQATHQNKSSSATSQAQNCAFDITPNVAALPVPEVYKPGVDVTKLESTDLQEGSGKAVKAGDCLTVKYYGTLASDGTKFDEDFTATTGLKLQLGVGGVIAGWDQGLVGMKAGGTRRLVIPSNLAYGDKGVCQTPNQKDQTKCDVYAIKPNVDLVFLVNLVSIQ